MIPVLFMFPCFTARMTEVEDKDKKKKKKKQTKKNATKKVAQIPFTSPAHLLEMRTARCLTNLRL